MIELRDYLPGDEAGILECFHRAFGANTPEQRGRSMAHWRWEFERNPAALWRILVAVDPDAGNRIVGQYAGVPIRMFDRGRSSIATQGVDSMVDPAYRRGLKRPGLFATIGVRWFAKYHRLDVDPLVYGMPVPSTWRIGNAFLRYEILRTQPILYREPVTPIAPGRGVEVVEVPKADGAFGALFAKLAPDLRYVAVRDDAFLNWRFVDHPTFRYRILAARDARGLRGYAVVRTADWLVPGNTVLVDWFLPGGDIDAARELLRAAERVREEAGGSAVSVMIPDCNPWYRDLQIEGFSVAPTEYLTVVIAAGSAYGPGILRREWYYTLAEFDIL
jgi:hypothetical protein